MKLNFFILAGMLLLSPALSFSQTSIEWGETVVLNNVPVLQHDAGANNPELNGRSRYGSQYGRLLKLKEGFWLAAYTVSRNKGYRLEKDGGYELEIAESNDKGRSWKKIATIKDKDRDLDNAQLIQLPDRSVLLASRSVRWQESYQLPVFRSVDKGLSWTRISTIDSNEGEPGELGDPDKGVYEPHLLLLDDDRLAAVYANEKHVTDSVPYSQVISLRVSGDKGRSWGKETQVVFEEDRNTSRPGMPVWTRMKNGEYILVYEVCGPQGCNIYYKKSGDGISWPKGLGAEIAGQTGAPFILSLSDGRLVLTSNKGNISISEDFGATWYMAERPWSHEKSFKEDWTQTIWSSLYQKGPNEIAIVSTVQRDEGGHNIQIRFGEISSR